MSASAQTALQAVDKLRRLTSPNRRLLVHTMTVQTWSVMAVPAALALRP